MKVKFQGFMLVVEPSGTRWNKANNMAVTDGQNRVGTFHLLPGDSMTKFMHRCPNAIEAASSIPKEKIEVKCCHCVKILQGGESLNQRL